MKILPFQPPFLTRQDAEYVRNIFKAGGVLVFPSDTVYGLAADPKNLRAVEKVFAIKRRPDEKAPGCIFRNLEEVEAWAEIDTVEREILNTYLPGEFTFLLSPKKAYPMFGKVGVRIPNSDVTRALSSILDSPYTATSANISGMPSLYDIETIIKEFKNADVQPDIILDGGELRVGHISTVVDLTGGTPKIIREGSGCFLPV